MWSRGFLEPGKLTPLDARCLSSSTVRLAPGQRVGEHVTEGREELLFVLEGEATLVLGKDAAIVPHGRVAYVPPNTRHDVANDGHGALTYVYVTGTIPRGEGKP